MSNEQDPKNIENEPQPADELDNEALDNEALDQVVGGTGPTLPTTSTNSSTIHKIEGGGGIG